MEEPDVEMLAKVHHDTDAVVEMGCHHKSCGGVENVDLPGGESEGQHHRHQQRRQEDMEQLSPTVGHQGNDKPAADIC